MDPNYETKTQHRDIRINHSETIQHIFEGKTGGTLGDTLRASNPACDKHRNTLNSGLHFHASLCKCLLHFCKGRSGETHPHHSPSAVRRDTRWHGRSGSTPRIRQWQPPHGNRHCLPKVRRLQLQSHTGAAEGEPLSGHGVTLIRQLRALASQCLRRRHRIAQGIIAELAECRATVVDSTSVRIPVIRGPATGTAAIGAPGAGHIQTDAIPFFEIFQHRVFHAVCLHRSSGSHGCQWRPGEAHHKKQKPQTNKNILV